MSFKRKSADRSTTLMCPGSWLMISCAQINHVVATRHPVQRMETRQLSGTSFVRLCSQERCP